MSRSEQQPVQDAGSSTDQQITGTRETGEFITDKPPTATTPATGSGNAGINRTGANRVAFEDDRPGE